MLFKNPQLLLLPTNDGGTLWIFWLSKHTFSPSLDLKQMSPTLAVERGFVVSTKLLLTSKKAPTLVP